jgi:hypothetical protein
MTGLMNLSYASSERRLSEQILTIRDEQLWRSRQTLRSKDEQLRHSKQTIRSRDKQLWHCRQTLRNRDKTNATIDNMSVFDLFRQLVFDFSDDSKHAIPTGLFLNICELEARMCA